MLFSNGIAKRNMINDAFSDICHLVVEFYLKPATSLAFVLMMKQRYELHEKICNVGKTNSMFSFIGALRIRYYIV